MDTAFAVEMEELDFKTRKEALDFLKRARAALPEAEWSMVEYKTEFL